MLGSPSTQLGTSFSPQWLSQTSPNRHHFFFSETAQENAKARVQLREMKEADPAERTTSSTTAMKDLARQSFQRKGRAVLIYEHRGVKDGNTFLGAMESSLSLPGFETRSGSF